MRNLILLGFISIALFVLTYSGLSLAVNYIMKDFDYEEKSYTTLEVKDNYGVQNKQIYVEQPASNPQSLKVGAIVE